MPRVSAREPSVVPKELAMSLAPAHPGTPCKCTSLEVHSCIQLAGGVVPDPPARKHAAGSACEHVTASRVIETRDMLWSWCGIGIALPGRRQAREMQSAAHQCQRRQ